MTTHEKTPAVPLDDLRRMLSSESERDWSTLLDAMPALLDELAAARERIAGPERDLEIARKSLALYVQDTKELRAANDQLRKACEASLYAIEEIYKCPDGLTANILRAALAPAAPEPRKEWH